MQRAFLIAAMLLACGDAWASGAASASGPGSGSGPVEPGQAIEPTAFTSSDGLPQAGVTAILQARDGHLWVGTFGGLARFDGADFRIFRGSPARDPSGTGAAAIDGPSSNRVLALYEDDASRLWVGTQDAGLSVFERGAFRHLPMCGGTCQVSGIMQSSDRTIWVATSSTGLYRLDADGHGASLFQAPGVFGHDQLAEGSDGRIYLGGHGGFHVVSGGRVVRIPLPGDARSVRILQREGESLLVGTEDRLYRYRIADGRWTPTAVEHPGVAARDSAGRWWVTRGDRGLVRDDGDGGWREVPELSGAGITSLAGDDEGNVWIGTVGKGLLRVRPPLFSRMSSLELGSSQPGRAIAADGHGGLWFGLACDALRHWTADGRVRTLEIEDAIGNDCVSSLLLDGAGALWVGTAAGSLSRLQDGVATRVAAWPGSQSVNLWQVAPGRYFVSLMRRSSFEMTVDGDGRILGRERLDALDGMRISHVVESPRGGHWFVGDQGVLRIVEGQAVERWTPKEGLSSRFARALHEDPVDGVLWVGTYGGGLNRIQGGKVRSYTSRNGLADDMVSCILPDDRGRLWLGGNQGVTLLPAPERAGAEIESVAFAANDGLVPAEVNGGNAHSCHRDARGRLWFSMVEGFAVVDPADVGDVTALVPRPYVAQVVVDGSVQPPGGGALTLRSFARNLEIRYTGVNLARPQQTRFRFRLSGFDRDWVEAGQTRSILYPTIPWGDHLFEVQARTTGGTWSPVPAQLRIIHPQPWYLRPWIWLLATSMGLLVLVGSTRLEKGRGKPGPIGTPRAAAPADGAD